VPDARPVEHLPRQRAAAEDQHQVASARVGEGLVDRRPAVEHHAHIRAVDRAAVDRACPAEHVLDDRERPLASEVGGREQKVVGVGA
jgi:hypothetical protein